MMSNKNNDLVIFESTAFKERLYECASSLPMTSTIIQRLLNEHTGEKNLNKLVKGLIGDAYPYSQVITEWEKISKNVDDHNKRIDDLIGRFQDKGLLKPSEEPLFYLLHALFTLFQFASHQDFVSTRRAASTLEKALDNVEQSVFSAHYLDDTDRTDRISSIYSALRNALNEMEQSVYEKNQLRLVEKTQVEIPQYTHAQKAYLQDLSEKFRNELEYIAKGDETDNIFRDVNKIGADIIPRIQKTLGPIVANERFREDLDKSLKMLEQDIEEFTYKAQSNIDQQIKEAIKALEEEVRNMLESEIHSQLQQDVLYLGLFVSTEQELKVVREDIKNWQEHTEKFIEESFQLPKDIQVSCERFLKDFECVKALENVEIASDEAKALKHLFGVYGTDVFSRVNCEPEDLELPENMEKIATHVEEKIDKTYRWEYKILSASSDELIHIFKHATDRLNNINEYLMRQEEAIR